MIAPPWPMSPSVHARPDRHPRGKGILFDHYELDPEQLGERQRVCVDAVEKRHESPCAAR
jgi:hypothetical protein